MEEYISKLATQALLDHQKAKGSVSLQDTKEILANVAALRPYVVNKKELEEAFQLSEKRLASVLRVQRLLRKSGLTYAELAQWHKLWDQRRMLCGTLTNRIGVLEISKLDAESIAALERFLQLILTGP